MSWLALWFSLQLGITPNSGIVTYDPTVNSLYEPTGYVQMASEVRLADLLFVGGNIRTEIQKEASGISFMPELAAYGFTAGLRWGGIEIGFLSECQHPNAAFFGIYHPVINWDGWYQEFYVRVSGEAKLF